MQKPTWIPTKDIIQNSNIDKMMSKHHFSSYQDFRKWSVDKKTLFWEETVENLGIVLSEKYTTILDTSDGIENAKWLFGAKLNIVDSCFQNLDNAIVVYFQKPKKTIQKVSQIELLHLVNRISNSFEKQNIVTGDTIAIYLPMTLEAIAIYLGAIKAGIKVATIADSFATNEISIRLNITNPKLVFTRDFTLRAGVTLPLYSKVVDANAQKIIVISENKKDNKLRNQDVHWDDFLSENNQFTSVKQSPEETISILFSSGTTSAPKAIPWNHTMPIKSASDGYYHQDIHQNDVICWPTNLGWMMGPWLVFAALINKASIALFYGAPLSEGFGTFVQNSKVTMLGVIPSIVKHWKNTQCMESSDWSSIKCFSSTGEISNPTEMKYLMNLAGNKPVIEYCGGTEIGGGYVASTIVQPNIPSTFSTQTLGGSFILLDGDNKESEQGELFLIPPIMGLSTKLLNKNHHDVYYKNTPKHNLVLRRHGDELIQLEKGYFKTLGRTDDSMNLGGIKVGATQIENVINTLGFVKESAGISIAPKGGGPSVLVVYYVENPSELSSRKRFKLSQAAIRNKLNPLFKVSDLVKIDVLPRTASNKVMRRKLRDDYLQKLL